MLHNIMVKDEDAKDTNDIKNAEFKKWHGVGGMMHEVMCVPKPAQIDYNRADQIDLTAHVRTKWQ